MAKPQYIYECGPLTVDISGAVERNPDVWAKLKPGDTLSQDGLTFRILEINLQTKPESLRMEWDGVRPSWSS